MRKIIFIHRIDLPIHLRKGLIAVILVLIILAAFFVLNIEGTTRQGVDYKVQTLRLPLYLKMLDFYDRHFNYKLLAGRITAGAVKDEDKVMAIFKWTVENLREQPKELKVIDDHVWHIIVRGYGVNDQFSDVFTTLCDYAGLEAFFARVYDKGKRSRLPFSFVKVDKSWRVFYPYNGAYFMNKNGHFASVEEIIKGDWAEVRIGSLKDKGIVYKDYFGEGIADIILSDSHRFSRANIQSPINRFIYGIRRKFCGE